MTRVIMISEFSDHPEPATSGLAVGLLYVLISKFRLIGIVSSDDSMV